MLLNNFSNWILKMLPNLCVLLSEIYAAAGKRDLSVNVGTTEKGKCIFKALGWEHSQNMGPRMRQ
jgi:hypothetical protein